MEDIDNENRLKEIYNTLRVVEFDAQWIDKFYEFEPYEDLLRSLRREVSRMPVKNNFLLKSNCLTMQHMISAVLSVIRRKKSHLSRRPDFQRRPLIPRRRNCKSIRILQIIKNTHFSQQNHSIDCF